MYKLLMVTDGGSHAEYIDDSGIHMEVQLFSNGRCNITLTGHKRQQAVSLSNRAAHELRDLLNKRYPNATDVQG